MLLTKISHVSGDCEDGRNKRKNEKKKKKKKKNKKSKKQKKGRRVQHRLRRQKQLLTVTLLPLSLRLNKTRRIQQENNTSKRGKSKYHTWV